MSDALKIVLLITLLLTHKALLLISAVIYHYAGWAGSLLAITICYCIGCHMEGERPWPSIDALVQRMGFGRTKPSRLAAPRPLKPPAIKLLPGPGDKTE